MAVTTIAFSDLNTWLQSQPVNTASTPYELKITGLTTSDIGDSTIDGTLGCIISQNNTKFVDLSYTQIPNGVVEMSDAFWRCTSLVNAPLIPDGVIYMDSTFSGCTALVYKSIIPSTVILSTDCYDNVSATEWRGTKSQAESFVDSTNPVAIAVDPDTLEVICTVIVFSNLDTWLQAQPANTADTPYELEITGLTINDLGNALTTGTLGNILRQNYTKYVDLRNTNLPSGRTSMEESFQQCPSLVYAPVLPSGLTNIQSTFYQCTALKEPPIIPSGVQYMYQTFRECTNLEYAPEIPSSVTGINRAFWDCYKITETPLLPEGLIGMASAFRDCHSLVTITNIPTAITSISSAFYNCANIRTSPAIPDNITNISSLFFGCVNLVNAPVIPDGVTDVSSAFYNCLRLAHKPIIPSSVTSQSGCYTNVTTNNLKGTLTQVNSIKDTITDDCEIQVYNNDRVTLEYTFHDADITTLSTYLEGLDANTVATAYKIYIRGLTVQNRNTIKTALIENPTKFVDLSYTEIPINSQLQQDNLYSLFYDWENYTGCASLVKSPMLQTGIIGLSQTFKDCINLQEVPELPSTITSLGETFRNCTSLTDTGNINISTLTSCEGTFRGCTNLTTIRALPTNMVYMQSMFRGCINIQNIPTIPSGVLNMNGAFRDCTNIENMPAIPNSVTHLENAFYGCTNLKTKITIPNSCVTIFGAFAFCSSIKEIDNVSSSIISGAGAFYGCSSLEKINGFEIPLASLDSSDFAQMFDGCTSLRQIGHKAQPSTDLHLVYLNFDSNSVEGKIYSRDKTSVSISQTSITKSTLTLPILTDELLFDTSSSTSDIEDVIEGTAQQKGMLDTHYSWFGKLVIPPTGDYFVLYAKEPTKFRSNIDFGGGGGGGVQDAFNAVYPIGCVYTQYPACKSPSELGWETYSHWEEITSDYDGAFFRTYKSGTSGDFVAYGESLTNKMQSSQNLNHSHGSGYTDYSGSLSMSGGNHRHNITTNNKGYPDGWSDSKASNLYWNNVWAHNLTVYSTYSGNLSVSGANHRHTISYDGGTEARPINYAIKIWKRTA